jgi:hypothetical protein
MGNIWWVEAAGGKNGGQSYSDQYQPTTNTVPAINRTIVPARMPSISRSEDEGDYTYWMGSDIQAVYNTKSSVDNLLHASSWDRQVLFLRDLGVSVVYDRTKALNSTDDSYITFCVPAAPQAASVGAGMARYDVVSPSDGFSGAVTLLLPTGATTRVRNWRSEGIIYQVDALAPAGQANDFQLMTVLDTAGSESQLNALTPLTGTGVEATQVGDSTIVGFVTSTTPSFPLAYTLNAGSNATTSYISGLTPGATYHVTVIGWNVAINTSGTGTALTASSAGVLTIATPPLLPGDANGDGGVSFADYLVLEQNFGKSGMTFRQADFNHDTNVSFADYLLLEANFGRSQSLVLAPPAPLPLAPVSLAATAMAVSLEMSNLFQQAAVTPSAAPTSAIDARLAYAKPLRAEAAGPVQASLLRDLAGALAIHQLL